MKLTKLQFKLSTFLIASIAFGILLAYGLKQREFESKSVSFTGVVAGSCPDGSAVEIKYFGNSIHKLVCVVIAHQTGAGAASNTVSSKWSYDQGDEGNGVWINGEKMALGNKILVVYLRGSDRPTLKYHEFDLTDEILDDIDRVDLVDFIEKWSAPDDSGAG